MNVLASRMDPETTSRRHLMHCLAREVGSWPPGKQESWLHRFGKGHSPELVTWLRTSANSWRAAQVRARHPPPAPFVKNTDAGRQGIEAARQLLK